VYPGQRHRRNTAGGATPSSRCSRTRLPSGRSRTCAGRPRCCVTTGGGGHGQVKSGRSAPRRFRYWQHPAAEAGIHMEANPAAPPRPQRISESLSTTRAHRTAPMRPTRHACRADRRRLWPPGRPAGLLPTGTTSSRPAGNAPPWRRLQCRSTDDQPRGWSGRGDCARSALTARISDSVPPLVTLPTPRCRHQQLDRSARTRAFSIASS